MSQRPPLQKLSSCDVKLRLSGMAAVSEPSCWPPTAVPYSLPVLGFPQSASVEGYLGLALLLRYSTHRWGHGWMERWRTMLA